LLGVDLFSAACKHSVVVSLIGFYWTDTCMALCHWGLWLGMSQGNPTVFVYDGGRFVLVTYC